MKKLLAACIVSVSLVLGGCATTGNIDDLIQQIRDYTAKACAFQPEAASVAALIAAFVPGAGGAVGIVNLIGDAICKSPTTKTVIRRGELKTTRIVQTPKGPIAITGTSYAR